MGSKRFAVSTSWYNWPDYLTISNQVEQGRESLPDYFDVSSETYLTITTYVNDGLDENGFDQYRKIALVVKVST